MVTCHETDRWPMSHMQAIIRKLVNLRWDRLRARWRRRLLYEGMKILRRVDAMPELDRRSADEILGYDDNGLPG